MARPIAIVALLAPLMVSSAPAQAGRIQPVMSNFKQAAPVPHCRATGKRQHHPFALRHYYDQVGPSAKPVRAPSRAQRMF